MVSLLTQTARLPDSLLEDFQGQEVTTVTLLDDSSCLKVLELLTSSLVIYVLTAMDVYIHICTDLPTTISFWSFLDLRLLKNRVETMLKDFERLY